MTNILGGRIAPAVSLCLLVVLSAGPAGAVNPVVPADGDPGQMICANCKPNTQTFTGNATGGSVLPNGDGSSNAEMAYSVPNDGSTYSGTSQVIIKDANG